MADQPGQLYYSNPDRIRGARVSRDMMVTLCSALGEALDEPDTRHFISKTRIPNERELYGTFIKALLSDGFNSQMVILPLKYRYLVRPMTLAAKAEWISFSTIAAPAFSLN